jgi:branched-chain amino acid transport system permease protein
VITPGLIAQLVLVGLASGAIYALIALGYSVIFSTTRILNFAQGEFLMIGALLGFTLYATLGLPLLIAVAIVLGAMALVGLISERLIMLPVQRSGSRYAWIIATLGVSIVLRNAMVIPYGRESYPFPRLVAVEPMLVGGVVVDPQQFVIVLTALLVMVVLELFLTRTFAGKAIRATAYNPDVAALMGIDVGQVVRLSFVLSAMLTGVAGILVAPITTADANMGLILGIKGFVAVVLGGMGSARGAAAGGMAIGLLDSVVRGILPAGWGNIAVFAVLALVLLIRPSGLFGTPGEHRS